MEDLAVRMWQDEEGQAVVEYALLLILVSLVAVSSMKNLASTVSIAFSDASADITGVYAPAWTSGDPLSRTGQAGGGGASSQFGLAMHSGTQGEFNNSNVNNVK